LKLTRNIWGLQPSSARVPHIVLIHIVVGTAIHAARTPVAPAAAVTPVIAAAELATPMEPVHAGAAEPAEHPEGPLLVVVEALVERVGGVGQFLQGGAGIAQGCAALPHALDRIVAARSIAHRLAPIRAQLAELTHSLLERRPVLLLLGVERKTRLQAGEPRITERALVLGIGPPALPAVEASALLRIDERGPRDREHCRSSDDGFPHGIPSALAKCGAQ